MRWLTEILAFVTALVVVVAVPLLIVAAAFGVEYVLEWLGWSPPLR